MRFIKAIPEIVLLCDRSLLADDDLVMERGEFIARGQGKDMETKGVRQRVAI